MCLPDTHTLLTHLKKIQPMENITTCSSKHSSLLPCCHIHAVSAACIDPLCTSLQGGWNLSPDWSPPRFPAWSAACFGARTNQGNSTLFAFALDETQNAHTPSLKLTTFQNDWIVTKASWRTHGKRTYRKIKTGCYQSIKQWNKSFSQHTLVFDSQV